MYRSVIVVMCALLLITSASNVVGNESYHNPLIELIEKIHLKSDSAAVFFYGIENKVVSSFTSKRADITVAVFTSDFQYNNLDDHRLFSNVVFVVRNNVRNSENLNFLIEKIHTRRYLIIHEDNLEDLSYSFSYFFNDKKFTRLFGHVRGVSYAYLPYADIKVVELGRNEPIPNAMSNLNKYTFRTVAMDDFPRVFWYTNERGKYKIGGYVGKLFEEFVQKHNARLGRVDIKNLETHFMMAVINATISNKIDISINAYQDFEGIKLSYPLKLMTWHIVAPNIGHLNPNQYFLRPFSLTVWISIGMCFLYIIVMDMIRNKLCNNPVSVWDSFSRNYLTILSRPTERPITRAYRFHTVVLLFSFVLVNFYQVYLTSFLTVYIQVKQHETIQDLIDYQVPVLMVDYEFKLMSQAHQSDLAPIITLVKHDDLIKERNSMKNLKFAYALGRDKAEFFINLQKYPKYHTIHESLKNYYLGFVMAEHCHFNGILNEFIFNISQTGLMDKWNRDGLAWIKKYKLLVLNTTSNQLDQPYPLNVFHLTFAWVSLLTGLTFAFLVFCVEKYVEVKCIHRYVNDK